MNQQLLYFPAMNIGGRIQQRLRDLGWERKDLLARVPDLSPQALSNLITRDSKRSEWDQVIATALGVSVMWLVYGEEAAANASNHFAQEPQTVAYQLPALGEDESLLLRAFRIADRKTKAAAMMWARAVLPDEDEDFSQRAVR